jgi:hypothetical protein
MTPLFSDYAFDKAQEIIDFIGALWQSPVTCSDTESPKPDSRATCARPARALTANWSPTAVALPWSRGFPTAISSRCSWWCGPLCRPPPNPPPPSPFVWGRTKRINTLFGNDFDLAFEKGVSFYREPNGEAAWETFSQGYGRTKALAASLDDTKRAELRRDFIAINDGFATPWYLCAARLLVTRGIRHWRNGRSRSKG